MMTTRVTPQSEPLHADLLSCLRRSRDDGFTLHHPLLILGSVNAADAGWVNAQYAIKQGASEQAEMQGNWEDYVWLHERPYRCKALERATRSGRLRRARYWKLVGDVWTDIENVRPDLRRWQGLWSSPEPERHAAMSPEELAACKRLPDRFTVYRGVAHRRAVRGLSWTLERERAIWFAHRFLHIGPPLVVSAEARREDVLAHFTRRGESEIVIQRLGIRRLSNDDF